MLVTSAGMAGPRCFKECKRNAPNLFFRKEETVYIVTLKKINTLHNLAIFAFQKMKQIVQSPRFLPYTQTRAHTPCTRTRTHSFLHHKRLALISVMCLLQLMIPNGSIAVNKAHSFHSGTFVVLRILWVLTNGQGRVSPMSCQGVSLPPARSAPRTHPSFPDSTWQQPIFCCPNGFAFSRMPQRWNAVCSLCWLLFLLLDVHLSLHRKALPCLFMLL